jgi:hypothetical protein
LADPDVVQRRSVFVFAFTSAAGQNEHERIRCTPAAKFDTPVEKRTQNQ